MSDTVIVNELRNRKDVVQGHFVLVEDRVYRMPELKTKAEFDTVLKDNITALEVSIENLTKLTGDDKDTSEAAQEMMSRDKETLARYQQNLKDLQGLASKEKVAKRIIFKAANMAKENVRDAPLTFLEGVFVPVQFKHERNESVGLFTEKDLNRYTWPTKL